MPSSSGLLTSRGLAWYVFVYLPMACDIRGKHCNFSVEEVVGEKHLTNHVKIFRYKCSLGPRMLGSNSVRLNEADGVALQF